MARKKTARKPLALTSFRQMTALAHPLRFRAFECLADVPRTGKQLAELLHKQPTRLYHHLGVLERAGLVRRVGTRKNRGTTEQYFQAVSDRIVVDRGLFREKLSAGRALFGQVLAVTFDELIEAEGVSGRASSRPPIMLKRLRIRCAPKRMDELNRRLQAWLADFEQASDAAADNEYADTVALYPTRLTAAG
jgi:DNA-binding transcriptional ArsR family regulator